MRTQQQAERAEQQRIKNLVLNYDLTDDQHDGEQPSFHYVTSPRSKRLRLVGKGTLNRRPPPPPPPHPGRFQQKTEDHEDGAKVPSSPDSGYSSTAPAAFSIAVSQPVTTPPQSRDRAPADQNEVIETSQGPPRMDKSGNSRSKQRARKLQLGDFDW